MSAKPEPENERAAELASFITYRISKVHPRLNAQAAHILRKHAGLSLLQWRIISLINAFGPEVSSVHIINKVKLDKGLFSRTLKALVTGGYVNSHADDSDHRRVLLSLSQKGRDCYDKTIETMRRRQAHLLHNVSDSEKEALFSALKKIEANSQRKDF